MRLLYGFSCPTSLVEACPSCFLSQNLVLCWETWHKLCEVSLYFCMFLRLNEGDDQFQVCNFAIGAKIGLQHDTSGRLGGLGRFPSRGAEKWQSSDFGTLNKHDKLQSTSSRNGHHLLWYGKIQSFTSDVTGGLYTGLTRLHVAGWNLRDLHGAMSSSNRSTHRRWTTSWASMAMWSQTLGYNHKLTMCHDI